MHGSCKHACWITSPGCVKQHDVNLTLIEMTAHTNHCAPHQSRRDSHAIRNSLWNHHQPRQFLCDQNFLRGVRSIQHLSELCLRRAPFASQLIDSDRSYNVQPCVVRQSLLEHVYDFQFGDCCRDRNLYLFQNEPIIEKEKSLIFARCSLQPFCAEGRL